MTQYRTAWAICSEGQTYIVFQFLDTFLMVTSSPQSFQTPKHSHNGPKLHWLLAVAVLFIAGCFNPSTWDKDRVAKDIKEQWSKYDITEVTLSPVADGFEGTAKDSKGETFKIKLKKDSAKKSVSGTGVGDRGTELDYSVSVK